MFLLELNQVADLATLAFELAPFVPAPLSVK
jgi:hypothetical protein